MNKINVAVIGGGVAGLTAAAQLAERGIDVTVFEASSQLGGRARTVVVENNDLIYLLDNGQHILLGAYEKTLSLLAKIGIDERLAFMRLPIELNMLSCKLKATYKHRQLVNTDTNPVFSMHTARFLPAPMHLLVGLLSCHGLTLKERWSAIRFMQRLKATQFYVAQDLSLKVFLTTQQQSNQLIQMLWEPLCLAALNTPLEHASTKIFLNVLRDSFTGKKTDSDFLLPRLDLSQILSQPLARYIQANHGNIALNQRIVNIQEVISETNQTSFAVQTKTQQLSFSHVILATSPANVLKFSESLPKLSFVMDYLNTYHFQPIYTVYLKYHASVKLPKVMTGLVDGLSQWVFDRGQLYEQDGLVAVIISAKGRHQTLTQDALALKIARELHAVFPQCEKPLWYKVIAEKRATFSCTPDLYRPTHKTSQPNLFLAGDYTCADYPATIEGAVRSGLAAASLIAQR
jgi:hydroxysqualene dehydroxylase